MLPFGIPEKNILFRLLESCSHIKAISENKSRILFKMELEIQEDKDNFDYLYLKKDLESLQGRKVF